MVNKMIGKLDAWIFSAYPARIADLAVYRMVYATYLLMVYVPTGTWLQNAPRAFFKPPAGLPALFTSFPPASVITGLNITLALAACLLLIGFYTRIASVAISLVLLTLDSWSYSLGGKVDHDILLVLCPLVLAFSGWGNALSLDAVGRTDPGARTCQGSWCLALLAMLIGVAMFQAGWGKMTSGWLDPRTHSTFGHLVSNVYATGRPTWAADQFLHRGGPFVLEAADWSAVALEIGFGVAFLRRQVMFAFLALACLFHLGVSLLFNIGFSANIIVYAAFVPFAGALHYLNGLTHLDRMVPARPRFAAGLTFIPALILALTAVFTGRPLISLIHLPLVEMVLFAGAAAGAGYLLLTTFRLFAHLLPTNRDPAGSATGIL